MIQTLKRYLGKDSGYTVTYDGKLLTISGGVFEGAYGPLEIKPGQAVVDLWVDINTVVKSTSPGVIEVGDLPSLGPHPMLAHLEQAG